ncbi:pentapeptide repeat-containing protein [Cellulomonas rhizosphaerae]|uniref:Pentapeptide repeat-containing protein n=1 Tax=Cellulomonas rhizosphaerae TaxID=2293719 RepID=A0A413RIZ5_9CELL|nr:pentapeptide repeat-containing protein [Cellulomonas rhizosphaerae]RHA38430.1 pentapeptide repeat-containing protein [Cellulomonas rhizosphaerae]
MTALPLELRGDCSRCVGLCCVASSFRRSSEFAFDREFGDPCRNLQGDDRCAIHAWLRTSGMSGCTTYDCFGAGQRVTQQLYGGHSWREGAAVADEMFADFRAAQTVHELLWYVADGLERMSAGPVHERLRALADELDALMVTSEALRSVDTLALPAVVAPALDEVVALVGGGGPQHRRADLAGRRLTDLRGACLRGASLLGADLRGADLREAALLGADLRGSDLRGADLSTALFVTPRQVASASGDATTRLPARLGAPPQRWG